MKYIFCLFNIITKTTLYPLLTLILPQHSHTRINSLCDKIHPRVTLYCLGRFYIQNSMPIHVRVEQGVSVDRCKRQYSYDYVLTANHVTSIGGS